MANKCFSTYSSFIHAPNELKKIYRMVWSVCREALWDQNKEWQEANLLEHVFSTKMDFHTESWFCVHEFTSCLIFNGEVGSKHVERVQCLRWFMSKGISECENTQIWNVCMECVDRLKGLFEIHKGKQKSSHILFQALWMSQFLCMYKILPGFENVPIFCYGSCFVPFS